MGCRQCHHGDIGAIAADYHRMGRRTLLPVLFPVHGGFRFALHAVVPQCYPALIQQVHGVRPRCPRLPQKSHRLTSPEAKLPPLEDLHN